MANHVLLLGSARKTPPEVKKLGEKAIAEKEETGI